MPPSAAVATAASSYNSRGLASRAQRRYADAIATFREGIARFPAEATLHNNLAVTLEESGDSAGALDAYRTALQLDPALWAAHYGAGVQLMRQHDYAQAEPYFHKALEFEPGFVPAHLAIYELAQIRGDRETALHHQTQALQRQHLFTTPSPAPARTVLAVAIPGDWQANVPVEFLFNATDTTLHKLYLAAGVDPQSVELPPFDVLFNCIAESDEALPGLAAVQALIARTGRPCINDPAAVLKTNRETLPQILKETNAHIPPTVRLERGALTLQALPFATPFLVRPVGSHAGKDLEKVDDGAGLEDYLRRTGGDVFYVTQFVDYRSADGYFRKHRIIVVDGEPYPFHMAISNHWMVHFYNSLMAEHAWMRAEEERFLADFGAYDEALREELRVIARRLGLDYFGVDCAIGPDGRLLVFEADPGVIVHTGDSPDLYPYKLTYVPRIFRAVEAMIDKRARSR